MEYNRPLNNPSSDSGVKIYLAWRTVFNVLSIISLVCMWLVIGFMALFLDSPGAAAVYNFVVGVGLVFTAIVIFSSVKAKTNKAIPLSSKTEARKKLIWSAVPLLVLIAVSITAEIISIPKNLKQKQAAEEEIKTKRQYQQQYETWQKDFICPTKVDNQTSKDEFLHVDLGAGKVFDAIKYNLGDRQDYFVHEFGDLVGNQVSESYDMTNLARFVVCKNLNGQSIFDAFVVKDAKTQAEISEQGLKLISQ